MEMEQKRGISITSTALSFEYRGHQLNLLDTPGHRDFSEDTYRVLAAVDAVVMVLDSAKGIEPQTLKLFEVCRSRNLPVITFLNKYDRPGREPLELLDEIEQQIGLRPTPATWPVGISGDFRGVVDRRTGEFTRFTRTTRGSAIAPEELVDPAQAAVDEGKAWTQALDEAGCSTRSAPTSTADRSSPASRRRCSSVRRSPTSACGTCSTRSSTSPRRPPPGPTSTANARPIETDCSAFVFKVQANMDRAHRDRIAFVRICSGRFERGMVLTCERTGKPFATKYASTVFGAERSTVEEAFPGDVVGLVNATGLNIGDSLWESTAVEFPPIPRFSPEVFATARPLDTGKVKQFRKGLAQLDEEGVVQVLRDPQMGDSAPILAAVGQLQFEVFADRLDVEFNAPSEILLGAVRRDPPHRRAVGQAPPRDRRHPRAPARRRPPRGAVREPLPPPAHRERRTRADARPHPRRPVTANPFGGQRMASWGWTAGICIRRRWRSVSLPLVEQGLEGGRVLDTPGGVPGRVLVEQRQAVERGAPGARAVGEALREEQHVAGADRHGHDEPRVRVGREREVGAMAARDATEPALTGLVVDERPLHADETVVHVPTPELVELSRVVGRTAAVQSQPAGAVPHDDPVGVVEPRLRSAQLEDGLEDRLVVEQIAEDLLALEESGEPLALDRRAGGGDLQPVDRVEQRIELVGIERVPAHDVPVEIEVVALDIGQWAADRSYVATLRAMISS